MYEGEAIFVYGREGVYFPDEPVINEEDEKGNMYKKKKKTVPKKAVLLLVCR